MNPEKAAAFRELLQYQTVAALGTISNGEPYVSMVPYALSAAGEILIHASRLAQHTGNMLARPRVSLLIMADQADSPQSRARVTVQGDAHVVVTGSAAYESAKQRYLTRFPHAADIFDLADFSMFRVTADSARVIGGFAQAFSLEAESIARALRDG